MPPDIIIRQLDPRDSIEEITALLHRAYAHLAEMGLKFVATHQSKETTRERLQGRASYIAESNGRMIGTVTLNLESPDSVANCYRRDDVMSFGQFGVEPEFQRLGIGLAMMSAIEAKARDLGARDLACDTAEPAFHLIRWYESLGLGKVESVQWEETNYRSVVLSKML